MIKMLIPILIVVAANTVYNVCAKSTPTDLNSFASLTITYVVAALSALIMFFLTSQQKNLFAEIGKANWTSYVLGIAIVGLEFGFLCLYRSGWKLSTGNLVASIALACVLVIVGVLFYKESLGVRQVVGMAVCAVGLILVAK